MNDTFDSLARDVLERVLVEADYHFLPVVTEHAFELSRCETSRLIIRRTHCHRVPSAAHFVANSLSLEFPKYPPTQSDVFETLIPYEVIEVAGRTLIDSFRQILSGHEDVLEEAEEVLRSFGPILWAAKLCDRWNDRRGVCRTEKELIYFEWITTA